MAGENPEYLYWNGKLTPWDEATVHVTAIAWTALGAVFEGIRGYWNADRETLHIFRLREHMDRLRASARLVRLPLELDTDDLIGIVSDLVKANDCREDTYIFPLVSGAETEGKRFDSPAVQADLTIRTRPFPSHLGTDLSHAAKVSSWTRISDNVMPPRAKNISNYRNGQLATQEVKLDGYDVAFLLNPQGKITEASAACVAFVSKGKLITPDIASGILESITRDAVITLARDDLGMEVVERPVDRTELYLADEVFTCGTAAEITPVTSVDKYRVGDGATGPVTSKLQSSLEDAMRGTSGAYSHWRTSVKLIAS